mmetsp:Transcript_97692/g.252634  ORF Transcript_97692/g.252634 Transcript_97692/m.252634 type:complete len:221 (-) Transcript_97692:1948-2610(-)
MVQFAGLCIGLDLKPMCQDGLPDHLELVATLLQELCAFASLQGGPTDAVCPRQLGLNPEGAAISISLRPLDQLKDVGLLQLAQSRCTLKTESVCKGRFRCHVVPHNQVLHKGILRESGFAVRKQGGEDAAHGFSWQLWQFQCLELVLFRFLIFLCAFSIIGASLRGTISVCRKFSGRLARTFEGFPNFDLFVCLIEELHKLLLINLAICVSINEAEQVFQ